VYQVRQWNQQVALCRWDRLSTAVDNLEYVGDDTLASAATRQCKPSSTGSRTRCTAELTCCQPSCARNDYDNDYTDKDAVDD